MRIGQRVMLIKHDGYCPPIGSVGVIVAVFDDWEEGVDYDVVFDGYPCPVPPDESWSCLPSWLIPLNDDINSELLRCQRYFELNFKRG